MSYTEEETAKLIKAYEAEPNRDTVNALAEELGKSSRSVIAKLSSAGVYKTPQRKTKTGEDIIKKDEMVSDIEQWLGITAPTLIKSGKQDLKTLHEAIREINEQT